jgi:hypothetical protein
MPLTAWMIDIAREQSPSDDWLDRVLARSRAAGYDAVGLYLEHRFAYPSAPWAAAEGCLTPQRIRRLRDRRPGGPRIIPFINTLGHMEGFIRSEGGQRLGEGDRPVSLQVCPSRSECVEFVERLIDDVIDAFDDEWVHIGGDEAKQLGECPRCRERAAAIGPAGLYAEHYAALCRRVLKRDRRPCLWGDMLLKHPEAMVAIPRETVIFDWQYETRPGPTTRRFRQAGFDVVCCPSVQSYNSGWCFLDATRRNIDEHAADAAACGALGVLVTTWELSCFSHYGGILPLVYAAGRRLARQAGWPQALVAEGGEHFARAARILGEDIPAAATFLAPGAWRQLRDRLVMRGDPFELWRAWRDEACGEAGDAVLRLCDLADGEIEAAPMECSDAVGELRLPIELHRVAVQWVRLVQNAHRGYAKRDIAAATKILESGPALLDRLRPELERIAAAGGSRADPHRLTGLQGKIDTVIARLCALPADSPQLPAFETITHDAWIPHDLAAWRTGTT